MWAVLSAIFQGILKALGIADKAQTAALEKTQQETGARLQQGADAAAVVLAQQRMDAAASNAPLSREEVKIRFEDGTA